MKPAMTFAQLLTRISTNKDAVPLIGSLTTAAIILAGYISFQFAYRPDFKVWRIASNSMDNYKKPLHMRGNHLLWVAEPTDFTPSEVKTTMKSL